MLSLPIDRYPPNRLTPQQLRARTLQALVNCLFDLARQKPVLFILEDLHWVDPTTLEFLSLLVDAMDGKRVMALVTTRPFVLPGFGGQSHVTRLTLNRLAREPAVAIIERLTGGKALPQEVMSQILARTDGMPLFVEELTKAVLESGLLKESNDTFLLTGPLPPLAIPSSLHDSLMARLDRLTPNQGSRPDGRCHWPGILTLVTRGFVAAFRIGSAGCTDETDGRGANLPPRRTARRNLCF